MNGNGGQDHPGRGGQPGDGGYPGDGEFPAGGPDMNGDDGDYGQLLRRPGEAPRPPRFRPGRVRPRQAGQPGNGGPANGPFPNGPTVAGPGPSSRFPNGGPASRGPGAGAMPGYDGSAFERPGRPGPRPGYGGTPGPRPGGGPRQRWTPGPAYPGGQRSDDFNAGADWGPGRQYQESNGRPIPPRADRLFRNPVPPGTYRTAGPAGPGVGARPGTGMPGGRMPGGQAMPGAGIPGQGRGTPGYAPGPSGFQRVGPQQRPRPRPRPRPQGGQYRGGAPAGQASAPGGPQTVNGQVIRQRDNALPEGSQASASQPIAAIAPDSLDSFARDLRALRAKAEFDYEEMAERSHYTMKTLASAAGGLRLPTLPVAIAYVRACDGDVAEWEDRWHKLAEKLTAEAARKQADGEAPPEPAEASEVSPAQPTAQQPPPGGQSEVYVITSAKPRQPDW